MLMMRRLSEQSYLSVDWQNPVNHNHPLNKGLVSWWLNVPHWQGGTVLRDLMGRFDGTLINMDVATVWVGPGNRPGGWAALSHGGGDDRVDIGDKPEFSFERTDPFSVSFWMRRSNDVDEAIISKLQSGPPFRGWELVTPAAFAGKIRVQLINTSGSNQIVVDGSVDVTDIIWRHVGFTYDGSSNVSGLELYHDGIRDSSTTLTADTLNATIDNAIALQLGARNGSVNYSGDLDDVRIYNRVLSAAEWAEYVQLSRQFYPGLLRRWRRRAYSVPEESFLPSPKQRLYQQLLARSA